MWVWVEVVVGGRYQGFLGDQVSVWSVYGER